MSAWLPPGLWRLLRLRLRAAGRAQLQRMRTPWGALSAAATALFLLAWLVPRWVSPDFTERMNAMSVQRVGPFGLLVLWVGQVTVRGGGEVLGFVPSEVEHLFAAPYKPSELLRYKITTLVVTWWLGALLLTPIASFYAHSMLGALLSVALVLPFLQLSAMLASMVRDGGKRRPWWRAAFVVAVALLPLIAVQSDLRKTALWSVFGALLDSRVTGTVLLPFSSASTLVASDSLGEVLRAGAVLAAVDLALVGALLWLGRGDWLESAAEGAQYMQQVRTRYRSGGMSSMGAVGSVRVPRLPRWGGVGPLVWRRLTEMVRRPATFATLGGVVVLVSLLAVALPGDLGERESSAYALAVASFMWSMVLVPGVLRADFRAELDHMDRLMSLPLRPVVVVLGVTLPVALACAALEATLLLGISAYAPTVAPVLLPLLVLVPSFAAMVVAVENALFLFLPVRVESGEAALQSVGRNLIVSMLGWMTQGLSFAVASACAVVAFLLTEREWVGALTGTLALLGIAGLAVGVAAWRFRRFDPSAHVPR